MPPSGFKKTNRVQLKKMFNLFDNTDLSLAEIGRRIGIHRTTIYYWLAKRKNDPKRIQEILKKFSLD